MSVPLGPLCNPGVQTTGMTLLTNDFGFQAVTGHEEVTMEHWKEDTPEPAKSTVLANSVCKICLKHYYRYTHKRPV